jgi:hypothetical protein
MSRFFSLESKDRSLLVKALALLWAVRAGLWLLPFQSVRLMVERRAGKKSISEESAERVVWAVRAASRYIPKATCLTQSLATYLLLARNGESPRLHVGVTKEKTGHLSAHAWVVSKGSIVIGNVPDLSRYRKLLTIEQTKRVA